MQLGTLQAGSVIQSVYAEYLTNASLTTVIPLDDTVPQITEGTEILTLSITPRATTSKILVRFQGTASATTLVSLVCALFRDSVASALAASNCEATANCLVTTSLTFQDSPATTSAVTYRIRVGPGAANTIRFNGYPSGRIFGGVMRATLVAEEIKV